MVSDDVMPKQFVHKDAERRIWRIWEELEVFKGTVDHSKPPFCVVIPPPNVTGILHMGHVLDSIPQDVMVRWHRMRGFAAVWIPGTDHAGIATQNVVKKQLEKEGIKITDLGRDEFLARVWQWKEKHGHLIIQQLKRLGCSCDWSRERFTMDEGLHRAVLVAFVMMYERGLIYRGKRMINWCTVCGTALSDDEVEHSNHKSSLWHIRYPIVDDQGNPTSESVVVATTRPETMLGDTAVAVHPDDQRYRHIVGKSVLLPLRNKTIPIVADSFVEQEFGTGVVKLTPAHDPNDYRAAERLGLPMVIVIGEKGAMTSDAGEPYAGLDRFEARKRVVADLETAGYLEKVEPHSHSVGECYRCKSTVEPLVSDQWFVKMRPLAEKAKAAVVDGRVAVVPDSEKHDYFHWMDSIQDWCISRQLWWGHRIPVFYCDGCGKESTSVEPLSKCPACNSENIRQDNDVLDTWFSSQLWPFATLGWPNQTEEFKFWYPNSWLMSGRDILFFWDSRMIIAGLELCGEVPFKTLVLHGLVRDSQGRKLSKSLGNSPDPIDLFDTHGTDAVRAAIALNYPMGRQDTKLADNVYKEGQALIIKIWNASRLLLGNLISQGVEFDSRALPLETLEDQWIVSRLRQAIVQHDAYLAKSDLVHACETVRDFFWNEFCDWYLEIIKPRLWGSVEVKLQVMTVALHVLRNLLKLFHPYIPFVTEELWQVLRKHRVVDSAAEGDERSLALSAWAKPADMKQHQDAEAKMEVLMSVVRAIRDVRHHLNIAPRADLKVKLSFFNAGGEATFDAVRGIGQTLGAVKEFTTHSGEGNLEQHVPFKFNGGIGYVHLPSEVDTRDVKKKLELKIEKLVQALKGVMNNLENPAFVQNAPAELVTETRGKADEFRSSIEKLEQFKKSLG